MGGWWIAFFSLGIFVAAQVAEIGECLAFCGCAEELTWCSAGVALALRYWAGSYDDVENSFGQLFVATVHHAVGRWRSIPVQAIAAFGSSRSDPMLSTLGQGNDMTDYWLKVYCGLALVNLSLYGVRVGFFLYRGVVASCVLYVELIDRILGARSEFASS